jgi:hypothetical protein
MRRGPRPKRSKGTWYVSFERRERLSGTHRQNPRVTETFRNEPEAKAFAKTKLAGGLNVSAGTLSSAETDNNVGADARLARTKRLNSPEQLAPAVQGQKAKTNDQTETYGRRTG